jgi:hypothetical protein
MLSSILIFVEFQHSIAPLRETWLIQNMLEERYYVHDAMKLTFDKTSQEIYTKHVDA